MYYSSRIAEGVLIRVYFEEDTTVYQDDTVYVIVPGLEELEEGEFYKLVGETNTHPSNHWGSEYLLEAIPLLANRFAGDSGKYIIRVNDMSLQYGGLFDISNDWMPPHSEHRLGNHVDIEYDYTDKNGHENEMDISMIETLKDIIRSIVRERFYEHSTHIHLRIRRY